MKRLCFSESQRFLKKIHLFLVFLFLGGHAGLTPVFSQIDPQAKEILDAYAAKQKKTKAYSADFMIHTINKQDGSESNKKGSLAVKGKKYRVITDDAEYYSNGETLWNYLKASNELNISKANDKKTGVINLADPGQIFIYYQKIFKCRYVNLISYRGKECHEIDLYPKDLNVDFFCIKVFIDKIKNEIVGIRYMTKMGIIHEISFTNMKMDVDIKDEEFVYDPARHPGAEVNDMRF